MTDFRALCEELVEELEVWIGYGDEADCADAHVVVDRARAALAEQPVAPTDEELLQIFDTVCLSEGGTVDEIHLRGLRAVLARWGQPTPQPPADGEVARFAGWLRAHSDQCVELGRPDWAHMVNRVAGLLEQRLPTPIPMDKLDRLIALDRDDPHWGQP
jgi:hypothetical protein